MKDIDTVTKTYFLEWQNRTRKYTVYSPPELKKDKTPLVIVLHSGGAGSGTILEKYDWTRKADSEKFILALPDALVPFPSKPASFRRNPQSWNDGSGLTVAGKLDTDDAGFINAMIDEIAGNYNIDSKRIYAAGFSNGASMVFCLGLQLSQRLAAIAVVSGHVWLDNIRPQRPVPLIYIIGAADPVNPLEGGYAHLPWNPRSLKPTVKSTIEKWLKLNNCTAQPEPVFERGGVKCIKYLPVDKGCEVHYYEVKGLGHVWPGGVLELPAKIVGSPSDKLNATDVIWDFFKGRTLP